QRAAPRDERLEHHPAVTDEVEGVRLVALVEEILACLEAGVLAAARDQLEGRPVEPREDRALGDELVERLHASSFAVARIAATSSGRPTPAGPQVMQRPRPPQPDAPNWSCQVESLCVSHGR